MEIKISGAMDDIVSFDGIPSYDQFCNATANDVKFKGNLVAPDGVGMRVIAIYDSHGHEASGCWSFSVGRIEEGEDYPAWNVVIIPGDRDYNMEVIIDAPEGTILIPDGEYLT